MTYTTQQLQAMSDHTINHALYHKLFQAGVSVPDITPDYCNNPNDIMPLAFERGISLIMVIDGYVAIKYDLYIDIGSHEDIEGICADGPQFGDAKPLRAIACLILMMDE